MYQPRRTTTQYKMVYKLLSYCLFVCCFDSDDGYRLTFLGYDYLAIRALVNRGVIAGVGRRIGVGKESGFLVSLNISSQFNLSCIPDMFVTVSFSFDRYL